MRKLWLMTALALSLTATPAAAEIVSRSEHAFTLRFEAPADFEVTDIEPSLTGLPLWWQASHTYSGDSANLSLDLAPGGCWCEALEDGTAFDHGRTVSVEADHILFHAPFGPLRGRTQRADLTIGWSTGDDSPRVYWLFVVEGDGIGAMAEAVDGVMAAGFANWTAHLDAMSQPA